MSCPMSRLARKSAALCLALALFFCANAASAANDAPMMKLPPRAASAKATYVYLHGIHGRAENGCPWMHDGAEDMGWLVCPHANTKNEDGTYSWGGSLLSQRAVVARAEAVAHEAGADADQPSVLVGFSQGAYLAMNLVRARFGRTRGLVLIGADVTPDRKTLEAAGVTRVVLAAGELDGSFWPMKRAAKKLEAEGMPVRFVSLGKIGHSYQTPNKEALHDAMVWAGSS